MGVFFNPWSTYEARNLSHVFKWMMNRPSMKIDPKELDLRLPVIPIQWDRLRNPPADKIQVTWIGHASFFVQMCGVNYLTDPVFSHRASPFSMAGPARLRPTPCRLDELPRVDFVIVSHNHYDHLDATVVSALGNSTKWFVPMGLKSWFLGMGVSNVTELLWWDEFQFSPSVKVVCTPCQHWCKRTLFDECKALWSSWSIIGDSARFFFAGDTGYCAGFAEIGDEFGPFDLAAIPIGAYEPRWFMKPQHVNPEEAVQVHIDVGAKRSVGMHFGTFKLTDEPFFEPPERVAEEMKRLEKPADEFFVLDIGETRAV